MAHQGVKPSETGGPEDEYTIDELARVSGVTVRNIRAHQSRGLLPPPAVRGRTGYYGSEHLARLRLITEMQGDGFNLNSIKRIFDGMPPGSAGHVLGFEDALRQPWGQEQPEVVEEQELVERLAGANRNPEAARRAVKLGIIRPLGGGRFEVPSPALLRAGDELRRLGVDPMAALDVAEQLNRHAEGVARSFVRLFLEQIWKPFDEAGRPEERWPEIRAALESLRPLAIDSLLATFQRIMADAVEDTMSRAVKQEARRRPSAQPARSRQASQRRKLRAGET
jgi:DNA-binding transcriptional MerR regulator